MRTFKAPRLQGPKYYRKKFTEVTPNSAHLPLLRFPLIGMSTDEENLSRNRRQEVQESTEIGHWDM